MYGIIDMTESLAVASIDTFGCEVFDMLLVSIGISFSRDMSPLLNNSNE